MICELERVLWNETPNLQVIRHSILSLQEGLRKRLAIRQQIKLRQLTRRFCRNVQELQERKLRRKRISIPNKSFRRPMRKNLSRKEYRNSKVSHFLDYFITIYVKMKLLVSRNLQLLVIIFRELIRRLCVKDLKERRQNE